MDMSQSECRELVMDREALRAVIHGIAKNQTQLSNWTELKIIHISCKTIFGEIQVPIFMFYIWHMSSILSVTYWRSDET